MTSQFLGGIPAWLSQPTKQGCFRLNRPQAGTLWLQRVLLLTVVVLALNTYCIEQGFPGVILLVSPSRQMVET